jgi:hypothetical protein
MESYLNCDDIVSNYTPNSSENHLYEIAEKSPQLQFKGNMTMSAVISHDSRS